ncbi:MAG: hypothetical protein MZW92_73685 [Comamonadaceae bacterium]|nr:hypothetical protein [Comamonadaceae bacterium]
MLMKKMIADGYQDARTLERRIKAMEAWLANPQLLEADADAEYAAVIEIDLADDQGADRSACPNDPDDVKLLSEVAGTKIDEVFIGSCMTNIGHFRAAGQAARAASATSRSQLWIAPPTKMDAERADRGRLLRRLRHAPARASRCPAARLCMGNQAQVREGRDGGLHLDPQLPEPPGQEHQRVPRPRPNWRRSRSQAGQASRRWPSTMEAMGIINQEAAERLPLHELRPDRGVRGGGQGRGGLIVRVSS